MPFSFPRFMLLKGLIVFTRVLIVRFLCCGLAVNILFPLWSFRLIPLPHHLCGFSFPTPVMLVWPHTCFGQQNVSRHDRPKVRIVFAPIGLSLTFAFAMRTIPGWSLTLERWEALGIDLYPHCILEPSAGNLQPKQNHPATCVRINTVVSLSLTGGVTRDYCSNSWLTHLFTYQGVRGFLINFYNY